MAGLLVREHKHFIVLSRRPARTTGPLPSPLAGPPADHFDLGCSYTIEFQSKSKKEEICKHLKRYDEETRAHLLPPVSRRALARRFLPLSFVDTDTRQLILEHMELWLDWTRGTISNYWAAIGKVLDWRYLAHGAQDATRHQHDALQRLYAADAKTEDQKEPTFPALPTHVQSAFQIPSSRNLPAPFAARHVSRV